VFPEAAVHVCLEGVHSNVMIVCEFYTNGYVRLWSVYVFVCVSMCEYVPMYPEIIPVRVTSYILLPSYFSGSSVQIFKGYLN